MQCTHAIQAGVWDDVLAFGWCRLECLVQEVVSLKGSAVAYHHAAVQGMVVVATDCWPRLGESACKGLGRRGCRAVVQIGD